MKRFTTLHLLVLLLASLLLARPGVAQDNEKEETNVKSVGALDTPDAQAVAAVSTARDLVDYGQTNDDPVALVTAARILVQTGARQVEHEKETEGGEADTGPKESPEPPELDPRALLDAAKQMARDDAAITELIAQTETMLGQDRGRVTGPGHGRYRVRARATNRHTIRFTGGEPAIIAVRGDGDTDLDCYIYDENGNLITRDTRYTDVCRLSWQPRWTGPFILAIRNLGRVYNIYEVATN